MSLTFNDLLITSPGYLRGSADLSIQHPHHYIDLHLMTAKKLSYK